MKAFRRAIGQEGAGSAVTSSSIISTLQPILTLHLPGYGSILLPAPLPDNGADDRLLRDQVIQGELEVFISQALGQLKCKAIRVGMRGVLMLNMGEGRGWEEDEIFKTEVNLGESAELEGSEGDEHCIWLEVGAQR
jgi:hypothetical protein